ncbi:hypothetical protein M0R45_030300 [Rubus argutus]|uniref:Uncharacterized protein n=1 Tax=Rubus argutus TaxID=59490 RepID=A0AAW1WAL9_RUBAR
MAQFGSSPAKVLLMAIMVAALLYATQVMAQDTKIAPSPPLETGTGVCFAGFLRLSSALQSWSLLLLLLFVRTNE